MSRIDDALRLSKGSEAERPARDQRKLFAAAWPMTADREDAVPKPHALPGAEPHLPAARPGRGLLRFSSEWRERLATGTDGDPGLLEQYRRLAASLHHARQATNLSSVMITSASPADGKTLTAVNLALVLAESYRYTVLLVDADLRRPSIPSIAELSDGSGLSDALRAPTEQKLALVPITPRLTLLPAGQPIANSIEALTSQRMQHILHEASLRYDWVILDAPPVGLTADARLLTLMVGGALFVVRAGKTQCPDVLKAIESVGREHILGIVLNGVDAEPAAGYYYGAPRDGSVG